MATHEEILLMAGDVARIVGWGADEGDSMYVTVREALVADPRATAEDIAEIVREARADAAAEQA